MNIIILARDEMSKLLSTRRGLLSLIGFFLIWLAVLYYGILPAARFFSESNESGVSDLVLPGMGLSAWQQWPAPELAIYWIVCLYLLPFLAVLTAADQTASDRSRGTLRYLVLRCSRLEIFFGRYLGQVVILGLVVLVTLASVLGFIAWRSADLLPAALASTPMIVVNLCLLLLPYIALMALVSILAKSARQATLFAVIIWISVSLFSTYLKSLLPDATWIDWILPGSQVPELLHMYNWETLALAPVPLLHMLVLLAAGAAVILRRDL